MTRVSEVQTHVRQNYGNIRLYIRESLFVLLKLVYKRGAATRVNSTLLRLWRHYVRPRASICLLLTP